MVFVATQLVVKKKSTTTQWASYRLSGF